VVAKARYSSEREFVFHPSVIGFPSLQGCHGLIYLTDAGMFAFHNVGAETQARYEPRFKFLKTFLDGHPSGNSIGRAIYGVCYLTQPSGQNGTKRAYDIPERQSWLNELACYASYARNFNGPIYGYDLGQSGITTLSAYVEFTKVGNTCVIQAKAYSDADKQSKVNTNHVDIRYLLTQKVTTLNKDNQYVSAQQLSLVNQDKSVTSKMTQDGLKTVYPTRLR
jgi:hypothetical protein